MENMILHPKNSLQLEALKAIAAALKVPYELEEKSTEKPYNPAFVTKIKRSEKNFSEGKGIEVDLKSFFDL